VKLCPNEANPRRYAYCTTRITPPDVSEGEVFRAGLVVRSSLHAAEPFWCLLGVANRRDKPGKF
jgi:hypothetical protein